MEFRDANAGWLIKYNKHDYIVFMIITKVTSQSIEGITISSRDKIIIAKSTYASINWHYYVWSDEFVQPQITNLNDKQEMLKICFTPKIQI